MSSYWYGYNKDLWGKNIRKPPAKRVRMLDDYVPFPFQDVTFSNGFLLPPPRKIKSKQVKTGARSGARWRTGSEMRELQKKEEEYSGFLPYEDDATVSKGKVEAREDKKTKRFIDALSRTLRPELLRNVKAEMSEPLQKAKTLPPEKLISSIILRPETKETTTIASEDAVPGPSGDYTVESDDDYDDDDDDEEEQVKKEKEYEEEEKKKEKVEDEEQDEDEEINLDEYDDADDTVDEKDIPVPSELMKKEDITETMKELKKIDETLPVADVTKHEDETKKEEEVDPNKPLPEEWLETSWYVLSYLIFEEGHLDGLVKDEYFAYFFKEKPIMKHRAFLKAWEKNCRRKIPKIGISYSRYLNEHYPGGFYQWLFSILRDMYTHRDSTEKINFIEKYFAKKHTFTFGPLREQLQQLLTKYEETIRWPTIAKMDPLVDLLFDASLYGIYVKTKSEFKDVPEERALYPEQKEKKTYFKLLGEDIEVPNDMFNIDLYNKKKWAKLVNHLYKKGGKQLLKHFKVSLVMDIENQIKSIIEDLVKLEIRFTRIEDLSIDFLKHYRQGSIRNVNEVNIKALIYKYIIFIHWMITDRDTGFIIQPTIRIRYLKEAALELWYHIDHFFEKHIRLEGTGVITNLARRKVGFLRDAMKNEVQKRKEQATANLALALWRQKKADSFLEAARDRYYPM